MEITFQEWKQKLYKQDIHVSIFFSLVSKSYLRIYTKYSRRMSFNPQSFFFFVFVILVNPKVMLIHNYFCSISVNTCNQSRRLFFQIYLVIYFKYFSGGKQKHL